MLWSKYFSYYRNMQLLFYHCFLLITYAHKKQFMILKTLYIIYCESLRGKYKLRGTEQKSQSRETKQGMWNIEYRFTCFALSLWIVIFVLFPLIGILCFTCLALSLWIVIFVLFPLIGILCFTCLALSLWIVIRIPIKGNRTKITIQIDKTRYVKHRIPIKGNSSQIQIVKARHVKQISHVLLCLSGLWSVSCSP
jgi:hypothetical protein